MDLRRFTENYLRPLTDSALVPLLHALAYNRQFKTLIIHGIKFTDATAVGTINYFFF